MPKYIRGLFKESLVACQNLHRNFIGIEISPEYCKIAEKRLRQKPLI